MGQFKDKLDPERLVEAAEASLKAAVEVAGDKSANWPYPLDLMGSPAQPECLCAFTRFEIQEACEFLVRLGILEMPRSKRAA